MRPVCWAGCTQLALAVRCQLILLECTMALAQCSVAWKAFTWCCMWSLGRYHSECHILYWDCKFQGVIWKEVCPCMDFILQSRDMVSLGISILMTDPPIILLIYLHSYSCEFIVSGAGSNVSPICMNKRAYCNKGLFQGGITIKLFLA